MRSSVILTMLMFTPSLARSADPAESVLTALRDAQSGHLSRYTQGVLDADCSDLNHVMEEHNQAQIHLEWKGESAYWKYTYASENSVTGEQKYQRYEDCEYLTNGKQNVFYFPESHTLTTSPVGRFSLQDRLLDLRPDKTWYAILPILSEKTWRDMLNDHLKARQYLLLSYQ